MHPLLLALALAPVAALAEPSAPERHVLSAKADGETPAPYVAQRVIGGRTAGHGDWPAQVSLHKVERFEDTDEGRFRSQYCAGTLITRQWVLTAAHCAADRSGDAYFADEILVRSGDIDLSKGDMREIDKVILHPDYDAVDIENDIALLHLAEPIRASNGPVGAIPLLGQGQPVPEGPGVVVGWGRTEDGSFPMALQVAELKIFPNATCNQAMSDKTRQELADVLFDLGATNNIPEEKVEEAYAILVDNLGDSLTSQMLCAGTRTGERDSCGGDSGGPLMVRRGDGRWVQVGIVSWGRTPLDAEHGCGEPELYSVYTRISEYFDWISSQIRG